MGSKDYAWDTLSSGKQPGVRRRMRLDPESSQMVFENHQDVTEILQLNQTFLNADRPTSSLWGGASMVRVAQVPVVLLEQWAKEGLRWYDRDPAVQAKIAGRLSSNDYSELRTAPGRLA